MMDEQIRKRIDPSTPAPEGVDMKGITEFFAGLGVLVGQINQAYEGMKDEANEQHKGTQP